MQIRGWAFGLALLTAFAAGAATDAAYHRGDINRHRIISGVENVHIIDGNIDFRARVDTGAAISSINARDITVIGGDDTNILKNIGKPIRFTLVNARGQTATVQSTVAKIYSVRTGDCREWRYHVYMTVEFRGVRTRVLVNLNDRSRAPERMLLGRDWLVGGYLVDVAAD
jgi:hypothetical protein